ncbi:alginate export family protein [Sphingomonas sp. PB4P5]|uniref:alginate export family protein n=1 Tax=Parasphingomonas puruogangriensis TaxID=3096155 RepID=UPI002FC66FD3
MRRAILAGLLLGSAFRAHAQTVTLAPVGEARLRYETVAQDGLADDAQAVTLRVRAGVQATSGPWSALAVAQGNLAIVDDFYNGLGGPASRPQVADPQNVALYLAHLQYRTPALAVTAGRQRITLDDERFVGNAAFRNNAQTYDAVRVEWSAVKDVKADVTYAWGVRTIWGIDGVGARQQAIGGSNVFANLSYRTPLGTATAFAYLVGQDELVVQGYRLSSQSYGARFAGVRSIGAAKLAYQANYARQSGYRRNPNEYAADYYLADISLDLGGPKLGAGYEVLGASQGTALTSFQTPLGAVFKFQGWADKFVTTPPDGVRDLYTRLGYGWKAIGPLQAVSLQAVYHRFASDRLLRHYGDEIDLLVSAKLGRTTATIRYADYAADHFATDTRKFWVQLDWTI